MISHFPTPYPDELLYSICARFADRVQYPGTCHVTQELFGTRIFPGNIHFPSHLEHLISVLPPGHRYTVDLFINQHTLFPFYAPFFSSAVSPKIREDMRLNSNLRTQGANIRRANAQVLSEQLRFCPRCVEEERRRFGECYWHRLHQIVGVNVCPQHACYLLNSDIPTNPLSDSSKLFSAEQAIRRLEPSSSGPTEESTFELQLAIAQDAFWLLNRQADTDATGLETLTPRYRKLLAERDLTTSQLLIRRAKLGALLSSYYPINLLRHLFGEFIEDGHGKWLIRPLLFQAFYHPVWHFLLMHFFGYTAEAFFTCSTEVLPFGKGPWPCLNPACDRYHQPSIENYTIAYSEQTKSHAKRPKGIFTCVCGFVYTRFGPDKGSEDQLRLDKVKTYGPVWEAALRNLWNNPLLTHGELARKLGVAYTTVSHQAARLGLAFPRPGGWSTSSEKYRYVHHPRRDWVMDPEELAKYRKEWLATRETNPQAGITFLGQLIPRVYRWLKKHDPDWLKAHLPAKKPVCPPCSKRRVDWEQRDKHLAIEIEAAALRLICFPGRPIQISRTAIARELEIAKTVFRAKIMKKLPLTEKALESNLESIEAFTIRRIRWAAVCYLEEHLVPSKSQLLIRSGTSNQIKSLPVQQALEDALRMLSNQESAELLGDRIWGEMVAKYVPSRISSPAYAPSCKDHT